MVYCAVLIIVSARNNVSVIQIWSAKNTVKHRPSGLCDHSWECANPDGTKIEGILKTVLYTFHNGCPSKSSCWDQTSGYDLRVSPISAQVFIGISWVEKFVWISVCIGYNKRKLSITMPCNLLDNWSNWTFHPAQATFHHQGGGMWWYWGDNGVRFMSGQA